MTSKKLIAGGVATLLALAPVFGLAKDAGGPVSDLERGQALVEEGRFAAAIPVLSEVVGQLTTLLVRSTGLSIATATAEQGPWRITLPWPRSKVGDVIEHSQAAHK